MKAYVTNQTRHAIILAGGDGTRLSEITRRISGDSTPKQFCPVIGNTSLLEQTRLRVSLAVDKNRIFTVLNRAHERHYRYFARGDIEPSDPARVPRNGPCNPICTSAIVQKLPRCMRGVEAHTV